MVLKKEHLYFDFSVFMVRVELIEDYHLRCFWRVIIVSYSGMYFVTGHFDKYVIALVILEKDCPRFMQWHS